MTDQHSPTGPAAAVLAALDNLKAELEHHQGGEGFVTGARQAAGQVENLWQLARIRATGDVSGLLRTEADAETAGRLFAEELPDLLHTAEEDARYQEGDAPEEVPPPAVGDGILYGVSVIRRALHLHE
ncbi:hypothetical protein [Streptomyces sp. DH37]|uniref:hypothetical protein n=1 Tax=Streptomyces sp. DH37 TaxID=3040122 RepID=UPI0024424F39|nr:hypothetical protein [Streptomyces sp. DH37]MDG9703833.1 hypothetical protein [Streptomyces sp. DH37]